MVGEEEQLAVLRDGRADMSFVRLPVDKTGLNVIPLYAEVPVVVAPADHEITVFDEVPVTGLSEEYLLQDPDSVPEWRDISVAYQAGTLAPLPQMDGVEAALDLVTAGLGVLILPMSVARHYNRKALRYRPVLGVAEIGLGLAWLRDESNPENSPVVEEFIGIVRGRSAQSSRQPSVQAKQAEPKSKRAPVPARTHRGGKSHAARRRRK